MIKFLILMSAQGKIRLTKWYEPKGQKERADTEKQVRNLVLNRNKNFCNVLEWQSGKLIYKRYASLFFIVFVDSSDNELIHLETIHLFVEALDIYFTNVCELDIIFNFHKCYYILDEMILAGEVQEHSKQNVLKAIKAADQQIEEANKDNPDNEIE